jgi:trimethylamine-N-oxide reductase (cytochrome c)
MPQNRGISKFKKITLDEAATIVANEIQRVKEKYGPFAVFSIGENGHHETKVLQTIGGCHSGC